MMSQNQVLNSIEDADQMAKAFALEETKRLLYDSSKRHNFFDITRNIFPFGEAWFEILSTWARIMTENPGVLRRAQQAIEGARKSGFFYQDPNTGEEVFNYPGQGLLSRFMFDAPEDGQPYASPTFTGRVEGLNLALGAIAPGVGPLLQFPASFITPLSRDPDWKWARDLILPFGPTADEPTIEGAVQSVLPAYIKKAFAWALGPEAGGETARLLNNTTMNVYAAMLQNGEVEQTPQGMIRAMAVAEKRAKHLFLIRAIVQFAGPTGPATRFDVELNREADPEGTIWSYRVLADVWREMRDANAGDDAATFDQFVAEFGLDPTAIVTAQTRQVFPRSVTAEGLAFKAENEQLFTEYPSTAYFAAPDPPDGEFDYGAYLDQLDEGSRVALTPEEWLMQRNRLAGEIAYQQARRSITDADGKVRTDEPSRAWLRMVKDQLIANYPGFGFDVPGIEAGVATEAIRLELERWPESEFLMATQAGRGLRLYLQARQTALTVAAERHGVSKNGFGTALSTGYLREWLGRVAQWIAMNTGEQGINPDFVALGERAYANEVEGPDGTTQVELMGETFPVGR
jgi:hypothetical protein